MTVARRIPFDDPQTLNYVRVAYVSSQLIILGAYYFIPGFFSNGTIGAGGVANEASISSFEGAHFNADGSVVYVPERSM